MTKKSLKVIMSGFCVFVGAAIILWLIYTFSAQTLSKKAVNELISGEQAVSANSAPLTEKDIIHADYYMARLEGGALSVYACSGGGEEFLYTIDIRVEDLPADDLSALQKGIKIRDRQALASFEEDYGS